MRLLIAALSLFFAGPVLAQPTPTSLDGLAAWVQHGARPRSFDAAPERLTIDPALHQALAASVLDGGMEAGLHIALRDGRLSLARVIRGQRYRTADDCYDCFFPRPIRAHTHPYENPFSVQDLMLAASNDDTMLMVTTAGQVWLALPTKRARRDPGFSTPLRYALFGNRLECPARPPSDGWAAPTAMGRRVEAVARAAAADLGLVLYVANPGEDLRRLAPVTHDVTALDPARVVPVGDLNLYETTLLRLMAHQGQAPALAATEFRPGDGMALYDAAVASVSPTEPDAEYQEAMSLLGNLAASVSDEWFAALPTTVYATPFGDLETSTLPFRSVQMSDDCRDVMVLEGEQAFAPNTVAYTRGWRRPADGAGAANAGWTAMNTADLPRDDVVPW